MEIKFIKISLFKMKEEEKMLFHLNIIRVSVTGDVDQRD